MDQNLVPLASAFLGRKLGCEYYEQVQRQVADAHGWAIKSGFLSCFCREATWEKVLRNQYQVTLGFSGSQNISSWRHAEVSRFMSQMAATMGFCVVSGNAYGVDHYVLEGTLSHDEFVGRVCQVYSPLVRHIVCLPSGIRSRAPRFTFYENGVLAQDGVYISLLDTEDPLLSDLLSPRDRLIVEMSDGLIVPRGSHSGTFDTILWALCLRKPVLVVDWEEMEEQFGAGRILKDLNAVPVGASRTELVQQVFESQRNYKFRFQEFEEPRHLADWIQDTIGSDRSLVRFVSHKRVTPPHNGNATDREARARDVVSVLGDFAASFERPCTAASGTIVASLPSKLPGC